MSIFTYKVVKLKIISDKVNNLYNFAQLNNSYHMHRSNDPAIWPRELFTAGLSYGFSSVPQQVKIWWRYPKQNKFLYV